MKKILVSFFILVAFLPVSLLAQSEFWAAKEISKRRSRGLDSAEITKIVMNYVPDFKNYNSENLAYFVNQIFGNFITKFDSDAFPIIRTAYSQQTPASTWGFDIANLADGMAKFLVERTKEELNLAFFIRLENLFRKEAFLKELFPLTYSLLISISQEVYNYQNYLTNLKDSFIQDLNSISFRILPFLFNENNFPGQSNSIANIKDVLLLANDTIKTIILSEAHPGTVLEAMNIEMITKQHPVLSGCIKFLQILSKSLRNSQNESSYWVSRDQIIGFFWNDASGNNLNIYLSLIRLRLTAIKGENIELRTETTMLDMLDKIINNSRPFDFLSILKNFCLKAAALDDAIKIANEKKGKKEVSFSDYYNIYCCVLDTFQSLRELHESFNKSDNTIKDPIIDKYLNCAKALGDIALAIKEKKYASIGYNLALILDQLFDPNNSDIKKMKNILAQYGSFICAVAMAENSSQIKDAINAVVMPAGGSNVKKTTCASLALNAYVGGIYRFAPKGNESSDIDYLRLYSPIGLALSMGNGKFSLSLFVPLFDIGALVSYRFSKEETENVARFVVKNIWSPGAYIVLGLLPGIPISLGFGLHRGPELTSVSAEAAETEPSLWRWGGFISVDIPLLNFWTLPR